MFREGKRSDQCLFKSVLIYLFRCVVCVYYRWKWNRECLVCLCLAGCLGLSIASDLQHLFCISSLPQAWPHMKTVPHVCYNPQQASCASLKKTRTVKQQDEGLFLQALDRWGWWISVDGGVKYDQNTCISCWIGLCQRSGLMRINGIFYRRNTTPRQLVSFMAQWYSSELPRSLSFLLFFEGFC